MYRLVVSADGTTGEHAFDLAREVALIGRRAGADVPLPHADVGGVHVRLERQGGAVTLVDGAIASGTAVNGVRLAAGARRLLADGDEILVAGRFRLRFHAASPAGAPTGAGATAALARAMVRDVLAGATEATPWLHVLSGGSADRRFELPAPGGSLVLGRGESCDVALRDVELSREHARLTRSWGGTTIADLGSKNGTLVDNEVVGVGIERPLRDGERIALGESVLVFRDPTEAYLRALTEAAPAPEPTPAPQPGPAPPLAARPPAPPRRTRLPVVVALVILVAAALALVQLLRS